MTLDHWSPLKLINRSSVDVPSNSSTLTGTPLEVNDDTSIKQPTIPFKPCFIWTADEGEEIPIDDQPGLVIHDALGHADIGTLQHIRLIMAQSI